MMANEEVNINNLNDDCLVNIFDYLPLSDKFSVETVCKRWQKLSEQSWKSLRYLKIDNKEDFSNISFILKIIKKCGNYLNYVDINTHVKDLNYSDIFKEISIYCQNITKFNFCDNTYLNNKLYSDYDIGLIFKNNAKISSVSLQNLNLNGDCFLTLNSSLITELILKDCKFETKNYLHFLSQLKNLKIFEMYTYKDMSEILDSLIKSNCESLSEFSLYNVEEIDDINKLSKLLSRQKNLRKLHTPCVEADKNFYYSLPPNLIDDLEIYLDEVTCYYLARFENLTNFECEIINLTDECVENLSKCLNLKRIKIIILEKYSLTKVGGNHFSKLKNIESFEFYNHNNLIIDVNDILKGFFECKNLINLDIRQCKFTVLGLNNICKLTNLVNLNVSYSEITDLQLNFIVSKLFKLKKLCINACQFLTSYHILELLSNVKINRKDNHALEISISSVTNMYKSLLKNNISIKNFPLISLKIDY